MTDRTVQQTAQHVRADHDWCAHGDHGWRAQQPWDAADLPVPRLELRWEHEGNGVERCWYLLVLRNFDSEVVAHPHGMTRARMRHVWWSSGEISLPIFYGVEARHDARQLGLPLFVTTTDGDVVQCDVDASLVGTQRVIRRAAPGALAAAPAPADVQPDNEWVTL